MQAQRRSVGGAAVGIPLKRISPYELGGTKLSDRLPKHEEFRAVTCNVVGN